MNPSVVSVNVGMRRSPQRINESPWARCLQGVVDARWVVVVVVVVVCCLLSSSLSGGGGEGGHMD